MYVQSLVHDIKITIDVCVCVCVCVWGGGGLQQKVRKQVGNMKCEHFQVWWL